VSRTQRYRYARGVPAGQIRRSAADRVAPPAPESKVQLRVHMEAGGGPREEWCSHYASCLAAAATARVGYSHCPETCQERDVCEPHASPWSGTSSLGWGT
jgi:hypothetical protein